MINGSVGTIGCPSTKSFSAIITLRVSKNRYFDIRFVGSTVFWYIRRVIEIYRFAHIIPICKNIGHSTVCSWIGLVTETNFLNLLSNYRNRTVTRLLRKIFIKSCLFLSLKFDLKKLVQNALYIVHFMELVKYLKVDAENNVINVETLT